MRRVFWIIICVLALFLSWRTTGFANGVTLIVDPTGATANSYTTINGAIDSASTGDTVSVMAGSYAEQLNWDGKDVHVASIDGPTQTSLTGVGTGATFDTSVGSGAILEGFSIENTSRGITVTDGASPQVINCVIDGGSRRAIHLEGGGTITLDQVTVSNVSTTTHVFYAKGVEVNLTDSAFTQNAAGSVAMFYLDDSTVATLTDSTFTSNTGSRC